jgi:hypothetical protein
MSHVIELNLHPDERTLRQFGFVALGVFGVLAACAWHEVLMFHRGLGVARGPVAIGLLDLGIWAALCSLQRPQANRWLYIGLSVAGYPIGLVLSYIALGVLFFAVFAPIGMLLRRLGRDPLQRGLDPGAASYWSKAAPRRDRASYFRQF